METKKEDEPDIVEGEVLESASKKSAAKTNPSEKTSSKLAWIISGLLAAFIGGLFLEPWFEMGMERFFPNSMPQKEEAKFIPDPKTQQNEQEIETLKSQYSNIQSLMETQAQNISNTEGVMLSLNDDISTLRSDLLTLQEKINNSEGSANSVSDNSEMFNVLDTRLQIMETTLSELQGSLSNNSRDETENLLQPQILGQLEGWEDRIKKMEQGLAEGSAENILPLALANLAREVEQGQSFEGALLDVRAGFVNEDPMKNARAQKFINKLSPNSESGVSDFNSLQIEFSSLIGTVLKTNSLPEDAGVWDKTKNWFSTLVVVRKTGEVSGEEDEALIARAEMRLKERDLISAVELLETLSPEALKMMEPWLLKANTRLITLEAVEGLIPIVFGEGAN